MPDGVRLSRGRIGRVALPSAEDLFLATGAPGSRPAEDLPPAVRAVADVPAVEPPGPTDPTTRDTPAGSADPAVRRTSGRVRHDEKMTVYVTADELHDLEQARLTLRARHGLRADRGRLVREALAAVLSDFEARGADSVLVRRLEQP